MNPPTAVPVRCPECGVTVALPVTRSLIVGNTATAYWIEDRWMSTPKHQGYITNLGLAEHTSRYFGPEADE